MPKWDVFISHASEDKDAFARPLAEAMLGCGLKVWFDEFSLQVGCSLRRSIDKGLSQSQYGIVVISPAFLQKEWPQRELDGLIAREGIEQKLILPVWHDIDVDTLTKYSPMLADRVATSSKRGLACVVADLLSAMGVEENEAIRTSIDSLEDFERHMLYMLYRAFEYEGFAYARIANHMNISERFEDNFDKLLHRGFLDSFIDEQSRTRFFRVSPSLTQSQLFDGA